MILISGNFIFNFTNFYIMVSFFLTKLLTLDVSFSITVRVVVVAKLLIPSSDLSTNLLFQIA